VGLAALPAAFETRTPPSDSVVHRVQFGAALATKTSMGKRFIG